MRASAAETETEIELRGKPGSEESIEGNVTKPAIAMAVWVKNDGGDVVGDQRRRGADIAQRRERGDVVADRERTEDKQ